MMRAMMSDRSWREFEQTKVRRMLVAGQNPMPILATLEARAILAVTEPQGIYSFGPAIIADSVISGALAEAIGAYLLKGDTE